MVATLSVQVLIVVVIQMMVMAVVDMQPLFSSMLVVVVDVQWQQWWRVIDM